MAAITITTMATTTITTTTTTTTVIRRTTSTISIVISECEWNKIFILIFLAVNVWSDC